jgi:outer membrane protein assembly factor BamA
MSPKLRLFGNKRISTVSILGLFRSKTGEAYNAATAADDVRAVWNTRKFSLVKLEFEGTNDSSCILVFDVKERPPIARIEVTGNRRVSGQAIRDHITSQVGQPIDPQRVDSDIRSIYHMGSFKSVHSYFEPREILVITVDEK